MNRGAAPNKAAKAAYLSSERRLIITASIRQQKQRPAAAGEHAIPALMRGCREARGKAHLIWLLIEYRRS
jgi:hypothetical protein